MLLCGIHSVDLHCSKKNTYRLCFFKTLMQVCARACPVDGCSATFSRRSQVESHLRAGCCSPLHPLLNFVDLKMPATAGYACPCCMPTFFHEVSLCLNCVLRQCKVISIICKMQCYRVKVDSKGCMQYIAHRLYEMFYCVCYYRHG